MERENETILLVEDEAPIRSIVYLTLESEGYHILEAEDGEQALAIAEAHQGPIHLLISDMLMPELDGLGLAQRLQADRPELRVLLMSGYISEMLVLHAGLDFIQKPFLPPTLGEKVREVLAHPPKTVPSLR
jgi:two-component system, cell cycle sensor histidine kinase and response regulator CckA